MSPRGGLGIGCASPSAWRSPRCWAEVPPGGGYTGPWGRSSPPGGARLEVPAQEDLDIDVIGAIQANVGVVVILLGLASLLLAVVAVIQLRRTRRLAARFEAITRGSEERSLEAILEAHLARVHQVVRDLEDATARTAVLERDMRRAFSRVGLVRYNPFEDTGGNQSFALALLDEHGDGFVMSSLHARNQTRVYAKGVRAGQPDAAMSAEEQEALRTALAPAPRLAEPS
ncbi:MAG: DUF4446 family protein [Chloroflexota bacterium]|nr:MAG: DUF4446 family protein [Chloroflexota bacterium]